MLTLQGNTGTLNELIIYSNNFYSVFSYYQFTLVLTSLLAVNQSLEKDKFSILRQFLWTRKKLNYSIGTTIRLLQLVS